MKQLVQPVTGRGVLKRCDHLWVFGSLGSVLQMPGLEHSENEIWVLGAACLCQLEYTCRWCLITQGPVQKRPVSLLALLWKPEF